MIRLPEADDAVEKEDRPTHEQCDHEPMHDIDHVIHLTTMGGEIFGNAEELGRTHFKENSKSEILNLKRRDQCVTGTVGFT